MKSAFTLALLHSLPVAAATEADARRLRTAPISLQPDLGSLAMRHATGDLLHFLEVERSLEVASRVHGDLPPHEDFQPACIAHTKKLIASLDRAYTDVQLRTVLENECSLDKMFVSVETGFGDEEACTKFAKTLVDSRNEELENGSTEGYNKFCDGYYEFKGGKVEKKPKDDKSKEGKGENDKSKEDKPKDKKEDKESIVKGERKTVKVGNVTQVEDVDKSKKVDAKEKSKAANLKQGDGGGSGEAVEEGPEGKEKNNFKSHAPPRWAVGVIVVGLVLVCVAAVIVQNRTSTDQ